MGKLVTKSCLWRTFLVSGPFSLLGCCRMHTTLIFSLILGLGYGEPEWARLILLLSCFCQVFIIVTTTKSLNGVLLTSASNSPTILLQPRISVSLACYFWRTTCIDVSLKRKWTPQASKSLANLGQISTFIHCFWFREIVLTLPMISLFQYVSFSLSRFASYLLERCFAVCCER